MIGCRNCEQVTSGDCGAHGAIHPTALLASEALRDALEIEVARLTAELAAERDKRAAAEARELRLREALAYVERKLTDPETEAELADACQRAQNQRRVVPPRHEPPDARRRDGGRRASRPRVWRGDFVMSNTLHRPGCSANRLVVGVVVPAPGTGPPDRLPRADPAIGVGGTVSVRAEPCRQHPTVAHGACVECLRLTREALRLCAEALALLGTGARVPVRAIKDALAAAQAVGVEPGGAKKETT